MNQKRIASVLFVFMIAVILSSCSTDKSKLVGTWLCGDNVYEFRQDGRYIENNREDENPSYYKILSGKRILIYTDEGEEYGITFPYSFKDGNFYLGDAKYTPYDPETKTATGKTGQ